MLLKNNFIRTLFGNNWSSCSCHIQGFLLLWALVPLAWESPLEKGMAIHSSILAWRIPCPEEPDRLQSIGLQRVGHDWSDLARTISIPTVRDPSLGFLVTWFWPFVSFQKSFKWGFLPILFSIRLFSWHYYATWVTKVIRDRSYCMQTELEEMVVWVTS